MTHCLVTGSTGYIGSRLVAWLARAGLNVTATARDPAKLDTFDFPSSVQRVELDVSDPQSARDAFVKAGHVDVAYFLVHSIGEGAYAQQDLDSAREFARAAREAGVGRIVYLGGFVPAEQLSEHLESRAEVGDALGDSGVELVWLRAAIILGAGSTSYELIRHLIERIPVIPIPTWMNQPVSPIAADDVLTYLGAAADPAGVPAGAYDIANGQSPTYAELIKAYAAANDLTRWWLPIPAVPPALVARIASWLTPLPRELTADLILSLPNTMKTTDRRIHDLVPGPKRLTTIADAFSRSRHPADPSGVWTTADPLELTDTDPAWARR